MMELGKAFGQVKIEVAVVLLLAILSAIVTVGSSFLSFLGTIQCVLGPLLFIINLALYLYMGVKLVKFELLDAFLVGGITGLVAAIVSAGASIVVAILGGSGSGALFATAIGFVSLVVGFVMGGVLVLIGYAIKKYVLK